MKCTYTISPETTYSLPLRDVYQSRERDVQRKENNETGRYLRSGEPKGLSVGIMESSSQDDPRRV